MDENIAEGDDGDEDVIHLLNTKRKNKEILSITNAAVDAVSSREHAKTKTSLVNKDNNDETKENNDSISDSFTSSKDISFNGRHRVRVSSRLLREIKSPLERSDVMNKMVSSESGTLSSTTTSSTLFASQSSSNQSSVQATGPVPTVIKYSSEPPIQTDTTIVTCHQNISSKTATPIVVKNSKGYFATGTSGHLYSVDPVLNKTEKNYQKPGRNQTEKEHIKHIMHSQPTSESGTEKGLLIESVSLRETNDSEGNVLASSHSNTKKPKGLHVPSEEPHDYFTFDGNQRGTGLCQGALSSNVIHIVDSEKGQVKAVSFSLSEREKATREMLSKRQESKGAIRRVVQPKLVPARISDEEQIEIESSNKETSSSLMVTSGISSKGVVDSSAASVPVIQLPSTFEKHMKSLISTLDVIEAQCQESRVWQEQHHQELERNIKQRDERRLQNLEDMQKQLLERQLTNAHVPPMAPRPLPSSSAVSGTTEELSNTQMKSTTQTFQKEIHPAEKPSAREPVQDVLPNNLHYSEAVKHKTQSAFKTTAYNKPSHVTVQPGLKRKLVRNTRTQTSPQDSCSVSSSEMTSPLETPLPRKRPPVPMSRDSKTDRGSSRKHVHFDTPNVRNAENPGEIRGDGRHDKAFFNTPSTTGELHSQTRYLNKKTRDIKSLPAFKRPENADHIVNDIGKLRQELKDALKETERTKLSLKNLHDNIHSQISDDDALALPDHTQPYPIDAYLRATRDIPEEPQTPRAVEDTRIAETNDKFHQPPGGGHYADALCILRDVQKRKEILETNLLSLTRQHEEEHLYRLVDDLSSGETTGEALRIRKEVAKKIEEIGTVVQSELQEEENQRLVLQKENSIENTKTKTKPAARPTYGVPVSTERRAKSRNIGKENQLRGKPAAKPKTTKAVTKQPPTKQPPTKRPPTKRPLEDPSYVSRVYGRDDHVPRRTTVKSAYIRHQSPVVLTKPTAATRDTSRHQQRWDDSVSSVSSDLPQSTSHKPKYYFQPSTHSKHFQTPLPGQLLSMAIPLGKPKTDPSLRLPVSTNNELLPHSILQPVSSLLKQPNVAVITIKNEECLEKYDQERKHKKVTRGVALDTKVLPNVDIDTSSFSDVSESPPAVKLVGPQILPCPDPLRRPGASEYEEFKDYEEVKNVEDMEEDIGDKESSQEGEGVISLHGASTGRKSSYQGPTFPPESIPAGVGDVFDADVTKTASETLENKAMEWVEQELLARVLSEMAPPLRDPTATVDRSQPSSFYTDSDVSAHDAEPDLLGAIGLRGIQLFVDAGIPVDNELVRSLIMEVLREKLCTMIGYPKPQTEQLVANHTEDEPLSEESTRLETPVRTPSLATSLPASRPSSHVPTPEETSSEESSLSLLLSDDMTKNTSAVGFGHVEDDDIEEGHLDDSDHGSPVATPVVSPRQSTINLRTPDVSEQDLPESEKTGIETPEITVSIRDRTPSPEDLDVDLKEQTLMEEDEEEVKEPDFVIPTIKFIPEPGPSVTTVTNSPSSITTTTYSTQSTMGTFATDDEISEGEQLQPYVHVGQYSEGEFAAPSALAHVSDNMATMREIPDDIFDSFNNIKGTKHDVFKQAVGGLLHLEDEADEISGATRDETSTSTDGQRINASETLLSQGSIDEDISQSEGEVPPLSHDVVACLLAQMRRQPLERKRQGTTSQERHVRNDDSASIGEVVPRDRITLFRALPQVLQVSEEDLSAGEVAKPSTLHVQLLPVQSIDRPQGSSVFDSDENNNDSNRSTSINDGQNQISPTQDPMVTPQKMILKTPAVFPRVVHVSEAQHESTPASLFLRGHRRESGTKDNVTMETLSDIHPSPHVNGQLLPQVTRDIHVTLPSVDRSGSPTFSEGPLVLDLDDTIEDASSISGGEI